jgi:putative transposase
VVLSFPTERKEVEQFNKPAIGIDLGITNFLTLSNGEKIDNPRTLKKSENKLRKEQRKLSKKTIGSNNRDKQRIKLAIVHRKIRNQRNDFLHKISTNLVKSYGTIVFEDLNINKMVKNHRLAKSIYDCAWNTLVLFTSYKAVEAGGEAILIDPRNTTQECSGCGKLVMKSLWDRIHKCPHCGLVIDRDWNASINVLNRSGIDRIQACGEHIRPEFGNV